jgi:hypothetical protein
VVRADKNTSKAIVKALTKVGWDLIRVVRTIGKGTDDDVLLAKAVEMGRVFFTRDTDCLALGAGGVRRAQQAADRGQEVRGGRLGHLAGEKPIQEDIKKGLVSRTAELLK